MLLSFLSSIQLMALDVDIPQPDPPPIVIHIDEFFLDKYETPHATNVLYPYLIVDTDPSDFIAVSHELTSSYHQFRAEFTNSEDVVIRVSTSYVYEDAVEIAIEYGRTIGQIPSLIRLNLKTLTLLEGDGHPSSGEHTVTYVDLRINSWGVKEENLIHDFAHASLNGLNGLLNEREWSSAVREDNYFFPSLYAAQHPYDEDVPETIVMYLVSRWRPERFDKELIDFINTNMSSRFEILDTLNWEWPN